jgi:hypothetical protein
MKRTIRNGFALMACLAALAALPLYICGCDRIEGGRGMTVQGQEDGDAASVVSGLGRQYAFFIAVDAYQKWPALKKPVTDAKEIRDILTEQYYIDEVTELYNGDATKENIIKTFSELRKKLKTADSIFIYYAGHGHFDEPSNTGFWIPVDAGTEVQIQENWLPNSQIRGYISQLKTAHVFLVSDACFSGDILNTSRALPSQIDNDYYRRAYKLVSRQVLTSGSSEEVPDESEFSGAFKFSLRKNSAPFLDPIGLYNDIRLSVRKTTPLYGTLTQANHQDGATFLFFRRDAQAAAPPPAVEAGQVPAARDAGGLSTAAYTGGIDISSPVAGSVLVDGTETGTRIKAQGMVNIRNVPAGATEVAVRMDDGRIAKAAQPVLIRAGRTAKVRIEAPAQTAPAPPAQDTPKGFVRVEGGTFTMGSPLTEEGRMEHEGPQHQVTVNSFYMGIYEVTQKEYQEVMGRIDNFYRGDNLPMSTS